MQADAWMFPWSGKQPEFPPTVAELGAAPVPLGRTGSSCSGTKVTRALPFCSLGLGSTLFYLPLRASRRPSSVNAALSSSGLPLVPSRMTHPRSTARAMVSPVTLSSNATPPTAAFVPL
jgi:hypothetical protein